MNMRSVWQVKRNGSLLAVSGIPSAAGDILPGDRLSAVSLPGGEELPIWWEARSYWKDGSIRWLFLHVVLRDETSGIRLTRYGPGDPADEGTGERSSSRMRTVFPPFGIRENEDGFTASFERGPSYDISHTADTSLPGCEGPYRIELLEDSPFAPLYRLRKSGEGCVCSDLLVRADRTCSALAIVCRDSLHSACPVRVRGFHLDARVLQASGEHSEDPDAEGLPEKSRGKDDDRSEAFGRIVVTVEGGRRRTPVRILRPAADDLAWSVRWMENECGGLELSGGISFRQTIRIGGGMDRQMSELIPDPGYVAGTGVFGPVPRLDLPEAERTATGILKGLGILLEKGRARSEKTDPPEEGLLHDGDWQLQPGQYGAEGYVGYADNEYDAPYAYFLAHAAFGKQEYLELALRGSVHMADMDCLCTTGDMLYHGYGNEAENHRLNRVSFGDPGHYWTDGLWNAYFWTGDIFAREAAVRLTQHAITRLKARPPEEEFAICERNLGWPLLLAVSAMETGLADEETERFAGGIMDFLDRYARDPDSFYMDPEGPVWWRCAYRDGSKPFMLGILGEAAERYLALTGDPSAERVLRRTARFIRSLFDPLRADFDYEFNAYGPRMRQIPAQQLIPLFVRTLLTDAAAKESREDMAMAAGALHACAWCLFDLDTGKDIALMVRGLIPSLAILTEALKERGLSAAKGFESSDGIRDAGEIILSGDTPRTELPGLYADAGLIRVEYHPACEPADTLNCQAFFHFCDRLPYHSCVSAIAFYNRFQVRFYDRDGVLIGSLDHLTEPGFFSPGNVHRFTVGYQAPGTAQLSVDGEPVCRTFLDRPLSGAFRVAFAGRKPGNWKLNGSVRIAASWNEKESAE